MSLPANSWGQAQQWLVVAATTASAIFAGLIWWLARQRLRSRYECRQNGLNSSGDLRIIITVVNRGDRPILIEALSVKPPLGIVVAPKGGPIAGGHAKPEHQSMRQAAYNKRISPEESGAFEIALRRGGGFSDCRTASIRLHIFSSFPVIRHRKKVLTAILPAKTTSAQDN